MASTCVAVMLSSRGHPAAWCTSTVYSAASCFKLQTTYVSAWKQVQKKKRSDSKPLFHAPLVHQGNNRLIQRLRSGPLESESCSHGGFGMAGVRQSLSGCVVLGTLHTLWQAQTNSGTQSRPWHQTPLCQNRAVFHRRRAQNPNNQHAFFFSHPLERGGEDQWAHLRGFEEKSAPPICHVGWKPEQTNTLGIEFEVGRSHIIYYIFSAGLTTWLCLLWLCLIWMCAERERLQLHILLHTPTCTFSRVIQCKLLWCLHKNPKCHVGQDARILLSSFIFLIRSEWENRRTWQVVIFSKLLWF